MGSYNISRYSGAHLGHEQIGCRRVGMADGYVGRPPVKVQVWVVRGRVSVCA